MAFDEVIEADARGRTLHDNDELLRRAEGHDIRPGFGESSGVLPTRIEVERVVAVLHDRDLPAPTAEDRDQAFQ